MKHELKIFRAPCTCAKCKPTAEARLTKAEKPVAKVVGTMSDYAKAIVALVSEGKWELPWAPDPPDLNALIRENAPKVSAVPPTPCTITIAPLMS